MLPPEVDSPNLTEAERDVLVAFHEAFVATGDAVWEVDGVG
jgi:hypothetical protein